MENSIVKCTIKDLKVGDYFRKVSSNVVYRVTHVWFDFVSAKEITSGIKTVMPFDDEEDVVVLPELGPVKEVEDTVKSPNHYTQYGIECKEFIGKHGLHMNHYLASAIEYVWRHNLKNGKEDLAKAMECVQISVESKYAVLDTKHLNYIDVVSDLYKFPKKEKDIITTIYVSMFTSEEVRNRHLYDVYSKIKRLKEKLYGSD